jgi:histidinol-phosphate aminotransferase
VHHQRAALAALQDTAHLEATVANNRVGMAYLERLCQELGLTYVPSQANFMLVDVGRPAGPVFEGLMARGVIVRPMVGAGRPTCIRVTIGTPAEMDRLAVALRQVLA